MIVDIIICTLTFFVLDHSRRCEERTVCLFRGVSQKKLYQLCIIEIRVAERLQQIRLVANVYSVFVHQSTSRAGLQHWDIGVTLDIDNMIVGSFRIIEQIRPLTTYAT